MEHGREFLRQQVHNAVMQHRTLIQNLEGHARQAEDERYRQLCERYLPEAQRDQQMLEEYDQRLGGDASGGVKDMLGAALGAARNVADAAREDDFLRIVGDIVTIRQSQDTFHTFATVGDQIGEPQLAEIGRRCEEDHDRMQRDFNQLCNQMFIEHVRDV